MFIINLENTHIPRVRHRLVRFKRGYLVRKKVDFIYFIISEAN